MKKSGALILLFIFLLNVAGYYGVFLGLQFRNNVNVARQPDPTEGMEDQTFAVKIPLAVPYAQDSGEFERVNGQFEYHGEFYQLVKQRLANDTLTVVCLKDPRQKQIHDAMADFVKTFTDPAPTNAPGAKAIPVLIREYIQYSVNLKNECGGWEKEIADAPDTNVLISSYTSSILHPPQL